PRRRDSQLQPVLLDHAGQPLGDEPDRGLPRHRVLRRGRDRGEDRRAPRTGAHRVTVVSLNGLTKTFAKGNVTALEEIDLAIEPGEFVSLIGPSGCVKSTLLRIIGDLTPPSAGTVEVNGKSAPQARLDHDYGMVFQDSVLLHWRPDAE